ncbi:Radical SAM domain protein [Solidesulfovibrio fructosivorans JJ]]|uniref:Radical SAM domain protein n=1 Tax=Solidesulfovibrio fructosivorans JJ] TaxID=596151 RepID=E1K2M1_SOLFR|nr:radical SAM protein [Solidesulfovibrio fructosivorans]EFL49137.1 Radical SAM domain protein [Solidesulfovibrio fructosivorans JJ]]
MFASPSCRESVIQAAVTGRDKGRIFRHPEPETPRSRVWPVFVTFQGCPGRCLFCAQHLQSGHAPQPLSRVLAEMAAGLEEAGRLGRGPYELAFYGGVFTALPDPWPMRFLETAARFREAGLVTRVRCSTRPDACAPGLLARLAGAGLDMVELGAQTFDDAVLRAAGRGHDAASVRRAAVDVVRAGMGLGVQLLPGLPGHTPRELARDAVEAAALAPEVVRLHPCLVVDGTPLAGLYREGRYAPWDLDTTISALADALPVLWRAGARVVRIGLCPEPALQAAVLAGPAHPALGARVRARALLGLVAAEVRAMGGFAGALAAPRRFAGEFFGHAGELRPAYAALGLGRHNVRFEARADFLLTAREV